MYVLHNNKINKGREDIFPPMGFTDDFILPVRYLANLTKWPSSWGSFVSNNYKKMHFRPCSPNVLCSIFLDGILGSSGCCVACLWTLQGDEPQWVMTVHAGCFITLNLLGHVGLGTAGHKAC